MDNELNQVIEKEGAIVWKSVFALLLLPVIAVIVVPWYAITHGFTTFDYVSLLVFYVFTGISITMGYHRLWSHRTYKANKFVSYFLMVFGTAALQNDIIQWSSDHRKHHKDVDDPIKDPYAATRGFWYSHFGWLMVYNNAEVQELKGVNDLMKDKAVMFQHKHYTILAFSACFGLPALYALIFGTLSGGLAFGIAHIIPCIILGGLVRVILVHHATFCINSMAHILGSQPYSTKNTARDSFLTAMVTGGEGYHNYHHAFAGDYRNGIRTFDFDPSKWLIAGCAKLGWCYDLKTVPEHLVEIAKAKIDLEHALSTKSDSTHDTINERYTNLVSKIKNVSSAKKEYLKAKNDSTMSKDDIQVIKSKYKDYNVEFVDAKKSYKSSVA